MISKRLLHIYLVAQFVYLLSGCGHLESREHLPVQPEPQADPIRLKIKSMTLDEKIGQMVIVGLNGYIPDAESRELIEKYHAGGFILFARNIKDAKQTTDLLNSLKATNANNLAPPLFLGVDEEGGSVSRIPDEMTKLPSNREVGRINNKQFSREIGRTLARQVKTLGYNLDFAPVLDIASNPSNSVIGSRSFGADASIVSELGVETMKGFQSEGVISVVKHFPGHGDTAVDSHTELPVVNHDLDHLSKFELIPFTHAIANNTDAIMIAHLLLPQIDGLYPATLSKTIITDLLRKEMNFDGVIVSDDMTMGAIVKNYEISEAAVRSVQSGSDIVLICHEFDKEVAAIRALIQAVKTGEIEEDRIDDSVYRIMRLKEKYGLHDDQTPTPDVVEINKEAEAIIKIINQDKPGITEHSWMD